MIIKNETYTDYYIRQPQFRTTGFLLSREIACGFGDAAKVGGVEPGADSRTPYGDSLLLRQTGLKTLISAG